MLRRFWNATKRDNIKYVLHLKKEGGIKSVSRKLIIMCRSDVSSELEIVVCRYRQVITSLMSVANNILSDEVLHSCTTCLERALYEWCNALINLESTEFQLEGNACIAKGETRSWSAIFSAYFIKAGHVWGINVFPGSRHPWGSQGSRDQCGMRIKSFIFGRTPRLRVFQGQLSSLAHCSGILRTFFFFEDWQHYGNCEARRGENTVQANLCIFVSWRSLLEFDFRLYVIYLEIHSIKNMFTWKKNIN